MIVKILITISFVISGQVLAQSDGQADWLLCPFTVRAGSFRSENVKIHVTNCTKDENSTQQTECNLVKNTSPEMTIEFKATDSASQVERAIVAQVPGIGSRRINIGYGPRVNACLNMTDVSTNQTCATTGIKRDTSYKYVSSFNVLSEFPTIRNIYVYVIIWEKSVGRQRSSRKFMQHPEKFFVCIRLRVNVVASLG